MKKLTFLLIISFFSFSAARTQDLLSESRTTPNSENEISQGKSDIIPVKELKSRDVDIITKNHFKSDFIDPRQVEWDTWGTLDEASFTLNGQNMKAYYNSSGELIGTTQDKNFTDLPSRSQKEILSKYGDYSIGPVTYYDNNEANELDMILWSSEDVDEGLYFVELTKGPDKIVVQVTPFGAVSLIKRLS